jgi:hypothetical protein
MMRTSIKKTDPVFKARNDIHGRAADDPARLRGCKELPAGRVRAVWRPARRAA